jgi:hypothetical protein
MSFTCPKGHSSVRDDYCDVCGAKNRNVVERFMSAVPSAAPEEPCPVCRTVREGADRYCTHCAYDFETGQVFAPAPAPPEPSWPYAPADEVAPLLGLVVVLSVDADRSQELGCPPPPQGRSERIFIVDRPSMVIGRDEDGDLQIPIVDDPYVSRQHAEIVEVAGGWCIRDLGSTNGTRVNGDDLVGSEAKAIEPDDVIELGCFSTLTVRARTF